MEEQLVVSILHGIVAEEFNQSQREKYEKIMSWIDSQHEEKDMQLMSFVARAYHIYGINATSKVYLDKPLECVEKIKKRWHAPHCLGPKHAHKTYFVLRAIKDIDGDAFDANNYITTLEWVKKIVNRDGGWSEGRYTYEHGDVGSDVETTSTAIQLLSIFVDTVKPEYKVVKLIEEGVDCLINLRDGKSAWSELPKGEPRVHATSHAVRAILAAKPYARRRQDINKVLEETLGWLKENQKLGGWTKSESAIVPDLRETALGLIALNNIYKYDPALISPYSKYFVDMINALWRALRSDHWEPSGAHVHDGDSLQYTSLIIREMATLEWHIPNTPYYKLANRLFLNFSTSSANKNSPGSSNVLVGIRGLALFGLFFSCISSYCFKYRAFMVIS